ncbi:hypothetical protein D3C80_1820340 [compost metagenome]
MLPSSGTLSTALDASALTSPEIASVSPARIEVSEVVRRVRKAGKPPNDTDGSIWLISVSSVVEMTLSTFTAGRMLSLMPYGL